MPTYLEVGNSQIEEKNNGLTNIFRYNGMHGDI